MFKKKFLPHLVVLVTFCADPFLWYVAIGLDDRILSLFLILLSFIFLIKKKFFLGKNDYYWIFSWVLIFLYINAHGTIFTDLTGVIQSYGYLIKILFILVIIYCVKTDFNKILNIFFKSNIFFMYLSVLLFFLLFIGIDLPYIEFSRSGSWDNRLYPLGIVMDWTQIGNVKLIRTPGITDEPGQLALLSTWLIILNEFTIKSKTYRKSLIICGLFTFSLAYLLSIVLIGFYFFVIKLNKPLHIFKYLSVLLISILSIYYFIGETTKSYLDSRIFSRMKLTPNSTKIITGDNRTEEIVKEFNYLSSQEKLIFGLGITEARKKNMNIPFSQYGIISYLTLYFPVFLLIFKKKKNIKIFLLFIICLNFLQRPGIHFLYQITVLTFIYYSSYSKISHLNKK